MAKHLRCTFCGLPRHGSFAGLRACIDRVDALGYGLDPVRVADWWEHRPDHAAYPYREPRKAPAEKHLVLGVHPDNLSPIDTTAAPKLAQFRPSHARPIRW